MDERPTEVSPRAADRHRDVRAGRSTVGNALEDLGWYVVDNLPPQMLRPLVDLAEHTGETSRRSRRWSTCAAASCSPTCRTPSRSCAQDAPSRAVPGRDGRCARAPIRAGTATASAAGRRHPPRRHHRRAGAYGRVARDERHRHRHLRAQHPPARDEVAGAVRRGRARRVTVMSFGFKYGLPPDADMVADCRFLPNPFWIPELSGHTGLDAEVRDYVLGQPGRGRVHRRLRGGAHAGARRVPAREQAARYDRYWAARAVNTALLRSPRSSGASWRASRRRCQRQAPRPRSRVRPSRECDFGTSICLDQK